MSWKDTFTDQWGKNKQLIKHPNSPFSLRTSPVYNEIHQEESHQFPQLSKSAITSNASMATSCYY